MFIKEKEERVVSPFIVLKAYNVLNCSDNFNCLNINSGTLQKLLLLEEPNNTI